MLISVIIPTFNYAHCIKRAIDSVLMQQDSAVEIIVIDDGSTDNTALIMQDYLKVGNEKVRYVMQKNAGSAAARNRGIQMAHGEYLLCLDADDSLLPDALKLLRQFLQKNATVDAVFAGHVSVDAHDKVHYYYFKEALTDNHRQNFIGYLRKEFSLVNGASLLHRRIFDTLSYPENFRCCEDISVFAHILALFKCASFAAPVLKIHKHQDSLRHNVEHNQRVGMQIVDKIFDPNVLPATFLQYRNEYYARRSLSLFRTFYLAKRYKEARQFYKQAVKVFPLAALQFSYLKKYLKILFK